MEKSKKVEKAHGIILRDGYEWEVFRYVCSLCQAEYISMKLVPCKDGYLCQECIVREL
jgi:hypothetical protein